MKRVAAAVGAVSMAIAFVHQYLRHAGVEEAKPPDEPLKGEAVPGGRVAQ